MPFEFCKTPIADLLVVKPRCFRDERGFFLETYKASDFKQQGIDLEFNQDNHSFSQKGILRGLHFQRSPHAQAKLCRVVQGMVWDVAVDLRAGSPTYLHWFGTELSDQNFAMMYVPAGFAHGFVTLSETAHFMYKCSAEYNGASDAGIKWDDNQIGIDWPVKEPILSAKDQVLPYVKDISYLGV